MSKTTLLNVLCSMLVTLEKACIEAFLEGKEPQKPKRKMSVKTAKRRHNLVQIAYMELVNFFGDKGFDIHKDFVNFLKEREQEKYEFMTHCKADDLFYPGEDVTPAELEERCLLVVEAFELYFLSKLNAEDPRIAMKPLKGLRMVDVSQTPPEVITLTPTEADPEPTARVPKKRGRPRNQ